MSAMKNRHLRTKLHLFFWLLWLLYGFEGRLCASFTINTTPFDTRPALNADGQTLTFQGGNLSLGDGALMGSHLGGNLQITGQLLVTGQGNIAGVLYPITAGNSGQLLSLSSNGQLQWFTPPAGGFDGQYSSLTGQPTLFSGNYADLQGGPTLPVLSSNVAFADAALMITSDWQNNTFPWSDTEVSDQLTLTGGNVTGSNLLNSGLSVVHLKLTGQANLNGQLWPTSNGSSAQVLAADRDGHLIWKTVDTGTELPTLAAGQMAMGNVSGTPTATTITGDLNISPTGVVSIASDAVGSAEVTDGTLTGADLSTQLSLGNVLISSELRAYGSTNILGVWLPLHGGNVGQVLSMGVGNQLFWADDLTYTLSTNSITSIPLADQSVGTAQLSANAIDGTKVQNGSLMASDLASSLNFSGNVSAANLMVTGTANLNSVLWGKGLVGSTNQMVGRSSSGNGFVDWMTLGANMLGSNAITNIHLANSSVDSSKIVDGSLVAADFAASSVTAAKIANDAVNAVHFSANAVDHAALNDSIQLSHLSVSSNSQWGTSNADVLQLSGNILGGISSGANVAVGGNLVSSSNIYNLGSAMDPWASARAGTLRVGSTVTSTSGTLNLASSESHGTALTLNSTGLGIGKTASANLDVAGSVKVDGLLQQSVLNVTSNLTLDGTPNVLVDTSAGNLTLTLPSASGFTGEIIMVKKIKRDDHYVRLVASDNIDGSSDMFLKSTAGALPAIKLFSTGSTWLTTSRSSELGVKASRSDSYMLVDVSAGPAASFYPVSYTNVTPDLTGTGNFTFKSNVIVLKWIPPGVFTMGNTTIGYGPEHEVTLTEGFWAGVFEVTQLQWLQVMGSHPYGSQDYNNSGTSTDPVHRVSWEDIRGSSATYNWPNTTAVAGNSFMGNLQAKTALNFDLPTEAEWEYTCRAGTMTLWSYGDTENGDYMWYTANNTPTGTKEVGGKLPNPWGLYDMHGNVLEWCLDWSGSYSASAQTDPTGALSGSVRVNRGGSWNFSATNARSARRSYCSPSLRFNYLGLRLYSRPW
jgi:formylglycine-generating enzyme required for sulfatase activity